MSPRHGVVATRRTALGGALGATVALAACEAGEPDPAAPAETSPTTEPPEDPDQAMVDEVVAELDELIGLVAGAVAARPALALSLTPFETLHRAHREVLTDEDDPPVATVRGSRADVTRTIRRREEQAQRRLADWSIAAESGALARLLASMSAAIAQQLVAPMRAVG